MVGIVLEPEYADSRDSRLRRMSQKLIGVDGALPDTYGMSVDDLAALLNDWLTRHKST